MPFTAVLSRASRYFYLRLSRFSARKGNSGTGLSPLTMLRHLANLHAPGALRQGIPLFSADLPWLQHRWVIRVFRRGSPFLDQDNACAFSGHLLTVEMLPDPARDGCSHDSTYQEKTAICPWMFVRHGSFPICLARATRPREHDAASTSSLSQARFAGQRFRANASGQKTPLSGSSADRRTILDRCDRQGTLHGRKRRQRPGRPPARVQGPSPRSAL